MDGERRNRDAMGIRQPGSLAGAIPAVPSHSRTESSRHSLLYPFARAVKADPRGGAAGDDEEGGTKLTVQVDDQVIAGSPESVEGAAQVCEGGPAPAPAG